MRIVCPNCATCYEVSVFSIGADGRPVRCARCREVWFAVPAADETDGTAVAAADPSLSSDAIEASDLPSDAPPAEELAEPAPAPDIETAAAAATLADHPIDLDAGRPPIVIDDTTDSPPDAANPSPGDGGTAQIASLAAQRRRRQGRRPPPKSAPRWRMPAAILALLAMICALLGWRGEVVRRAPQMASLYSAIGLPVNLRKLIFADVRMTREIHDGVAMLLIQGTIVSASPAPIQIPRLRFAVRNEAGAELYAWTAPPPQPKLAPFESLTFQSRVASPPDDGRSIVVRFFNRRDAVASLR